MKKNYYDSDKRYTIVIVVASLLLLAILLYLFLGPMSKGRRYEKQIESAELHFLSGEYEDALKALENAVELKETEDAYLLMAEVYLAMGDTDRAENALRLASVKFDSAEIDKMLAELQPEDVEPQPEEIETVVIYGKEHRIDTKILDLSNRELTDLTPLTQLNALESLTLTGNKISDLQPLSSLTSLTYLHLGNNKITDLSPLTSLTALRSLYLDGNESPDLSVLETMKSLTTLSIRGMELTKDQLESLRSALPNCNVYCDEDSIVEEITLAGITFMSDITELDLRSLNISDISELAKCTQLTKLDLRDNEITNIDALSGLTELTWLCLWDNDIEDIAALLPLSKLSYLDLDDNGVTNLAPLKGLENMEELWLSDNDPQNINALTSMPKLRRLGLKDTMLTDEDIDILCQIQTLEELAIERNEISADSLDKLVAALPDCTITHDDPYYTFEVDGTVYKSTDTEILSISGKNLHSLEAISNFTALKSLNVSDNTLSDLSPLAGLVKLRTLDLGNVAGGSNAYADLSPLSALTDLRSLSLPNSGVSDVSALGSLTALNELILSFNGITDISAAASMTQLQSLSLENNRITDISSLSGLHNLSYLGLTGNPIRDLSPLYGLSNLRELYISGCNVTAEQVRELQAALPKCTIGTDLDLTVPEEPAE